MSAAALIADHVATGAAQGGGPRVIGVAGAQGSGKSTAAEGAARLLRERGLGVAVLSLDDLYLPRAERMRLARDVHPLFAVRGPPGTHDVALGGALVDRMRAGEATGGPRFDKLADDRLPAARGRCFPCGLDVVLFEGWCVGASRAPPGEDLAAPINALEAEEDGEGVWRRAIEEALAGPYRALFARVDGLVFLRAPSVEVVPRWRLEQERANACSGGGGAPPPMDGAAVDRFVQHYERITWRMLRETPKAADLVIALDEDRRVLGAEARGGG